MVRMLPILVVIAACGKKSDAPSPPGKDATKTAALLDASAVDPDEPTIPPPEPTVKAGAKGDCKTEYAPRPTRDPNPMCKIVGGEFVMGTDEQDLPDGIPAETKEVPAHRVSVAPFFLDQFEVTVAQIVHFLEAVPDNLCENAKGKCFLTSQTSSSPISHEGAVATAKPGTERHPFTMATIEGAERYCAWAGKRLPTEAEWELAARLDPSTGKSLVYPWGDAFEPRRANCAEKDCQDGFDRLAPVGSFDGSELLDGSSPWGVHDLAGNGSEVVANCQVPYAACEGGPCLDRRGDVSPGCKRARRSHSFAAEGSRIRSAVRQEALSSDGFRCAR